MFKWFITSRICLLDMIKTWDLLNLPAWIPIQHGSMDQFSSVIESKNEIVALTQIRENTRIVHFQRFSKYDVRKGRNEGLEINFKRVKIIFVLIWRKFLSPVLHWAKRHSKSYCIHVVLILYKAGCLIMTHKLVCNTIISGIYRS